MPIRVRCSQCHTLYNVADDKIGKSIRCSKCQAVFHAVAPTVPLEMPEVLPAPPAAAQSESEVQPVAAVPAEAVLAVTTAPSKGKKKSVVLVLLGGCAAVLFLLFAVCGVGGYVAYVKIYEGVEAVRKDLTQLNNIPQNADPVPNPSPGDTDKPSDKDKPKPNEKPDDKVKPKDNEKPKEPDKPKDNEKPKEPDKPKEIVKPIDNQAYTLKIKSQPGAGKMMRVAVSDTVTGTVKEVIGQRLPQTRPVNRKIEDVHTCIVVEPGQPRAVRFKETYEKAFWPDPLPSVLPYQGRTITYDLQGDNYRVTASGDVDLAPNHLVTLARHARIAYLDSVLLPNKPVRVGDTWPLDVKALCERYFSHLEINVADSKANAKFEKIIEKDGKSVAVLALDLQLSIIKTTWVTPYATDLKATAELHGTQEFPLDGGDTTGSVSLTGKLTAHYIDKLLSQAVADLDADVTLKEEHSPEGAAPPPPVETGWQKIETMQGRYTAEFPGKPKVVVGRGEFIDDKGVIYTIQLFHIRQNVPTTPQQLLEFVRPKDAAKATDRQDLTIDKGFGIEFTLEQNGAGVLRERVYLVKGYRWEIKVQAPKDVVPAKEDVKRFFESFKVLETP